MNRYTGKQSLLDASLGEYAEQGFYLNEPDDHFTELYFKDRLIATFSQVAVTIPVLHTACRQYLISIS